MLHAYEARTLRQPAGASSLTIMDITAQAARLPAFENHESIWLGRDEKRGLRAIVAIHDTTLGPALGGTRIWPYASFEEALADALRLSCGMTYKAAIADLPLGGGKAVIMADPKTGKTAALLAAYAEMLAALNGQFITGEDVGLTLADADFLRARTPNVTGTTRGGSGNPSPVTAKGVYLGIKAAAKHRFGTDDLTGRRVAVQGLGAVGSALCEKLHRAGASLAVADIDAARVERACRDFGAAALATEEILSADADIFAPCALGGVLSEKTIPLLKTPIVAGSANNQLANHADVRLLMERGILYAPDYVINAGGLINVAGELAPGGYDPDAALSRVATIPTVLADIFRRADAEKRPTNDIAAEIALKRLQAAASQPPRVPI